MQNLRRGHCALGVDAQNLWVPKISSTQITPPTGARE
jgi:hypothetical protein